MSTSTSHLRDEWSDPLRDEWAERPAREEWREPRAHAEPRESEPLMSLIRRLADEVTTLFAQELALLKSETTHALDDLKTGVASVALGGMVILLGLIFLLLSAVYGLSTVVAPWLAALIVGGAVTIVGALMLLSGKKKLEPSNMAPRHTAASLRKDTEMIKGATQ